MTGAIRVTKHKTLLKETGVEPLKTHRKLHRLTYVFKIKTNLTPDYLFNIHLLSSHNTHNYDLRRPSQLIPIKARTATYYNSFFPATIRDWNGLPKDVLTARSVLCFKKLLQQMDGQKTNSVYSIEHGYENITHTRLGLGLSSLNEHLFKYNLCLSKCCEQCSGNHTETTELYLPHCNRYSVSRSTLLLGIKHILCPVLNITLLRDLCPTHLSTIMTEGSDDLFININHKTF